MNKQGNTYTIIYTSVMVIAVAFILAFAAIGLKPAQERNIAIDKMSQSHRHPRTLRSYTENISTILL